MVFSCDMGEEIRDDFIELGKSDVPRLDGIAAAKGDGVIEGAVDGAMALDAGETTGETDGGTTVAPATVGAAVIPS